MIQIINENHYPISKINKLSEHLDVSKSILELSMANRPTYDELEQRVKELGQVFKFLTE
jgi:hypothetical protein